MATWLQDKDHPNQFTLILDMPSTEILRSDIHIGLVFSSTAPIRWHYRFRRYYERVAGTGPWIETKTEPPWKLGRTMRQYLQDRIREELADILIDLELGDFIPMDTAEAPPGFDRRQIVSMLLASRIHRMVEPSPHNAIAESVSAIRKASGLNVVRFAIACQTGEATIRHIESSLGSAAPSTLRRIASIGRKCYEWKAANFLDAQAMIEERKTKKQGGHR